MVFVVFTFVCFCVNINECNLFYSRKTRHTPGKIQIHYNEQVNPKFKFDEGVKQFSTINMDDWSIELNNKGIDISKKDLNDIYNTIKHAIVGSHYTYNVYIEPETIGAANGKYIVGAWKGEIYVNKLQDIWVYRLIQGTKPVTCTQTIHHKEVEKVLGIKFVDKWTTTDGVACGIYMIGPLISNIVGHLDTEWNTLYLAKPIENEAQIHTEL